MKSWLAAGTLLLVVGLLKIRQHVNAPMSLEDYLAFRCGSVGDSHTESFLSFAGHCWGCPVSAIGAAMIAYALYLAFAGLQRPARHFVMARKG